MNKIGTPSSDLCDLTLVEAADAVASGAISSVALTEAALKAFDAWDPSINASIWLDNEEALETAEKMDKTRAAGVTLGPLHGVPFAHKDMYYQAGKLTTCGSKIRADFRPDYTATVMDRLHSAGSITLGGLNMAEFAQNPTGHNVHYGDCHNPWGKGYCTGGSSSGSGAAVGARCVTVALGSDTGGSIRLPAGICGVTGLKATQGRVSRYGVMPLSHSCDNVGPLARSARDCARVISVIAGPDPMDPTTLADPPINYEAALTGDIKGLKIGVPINYFFDDIDEEVLSAFESAMAVMKELGAKIIPVELPLMSEISTYGSVVSRCESVTIHGEWLRTRPQDYSTHVGSRNYPGAGIPASYYLEAVNRRGPILKAFAGEVFSKVDVFAAPTIRSKVPTLDATRMETGEPDKIDAFGAVSLNTRPANYLGLPSLSAPCGFDTGGMPIGMLIHGRPLGEARILRVADAYQRVTDWHKAKPAPW
jgi:aspartyl-tRNA(Asn)/glutamyl-tRNA(Gln) amidotransferase subunit A